MTCLRPGCPDLRVTESTDDTKSSGIGHGSSQLRTSGNIHAPSNAVSTSPMDLA